MLLKLLDLKYTKGNKSVMCRTDEFNFVIFCLKGKIKVMLNNPNGDRELKECSDGNFILHKNIPVSKIFLDDSESILMLKSEGFEKLFEGCNINPEEFLINFQNGSYLFRIVDRKVEYRKIESKG